jgi:hypothetical protein
MKDIQKQLEKYSHYDGTPFFQLAEKQLESIYKVIEENTSNSASTFKKHLFSIAAKEHRQMFSNKIDNDETFQFLKNTNLPDDHTEVLQSKNNVDTNFKYGIFSERILRVCERCAESYTQHKQLFKQAFNAKEPRFYFHPLETESLEQMEDGIIRVIHNNKVKKYANSFLRSYKNLMNEESYNLFDTIMDKDLDREFIQNEIRKVASFKDSNDLNKVLTKIVENEHSVDYILSIIENKKLDVDTLLKTDKGLVISINDFEASEALGSNQWCISTHEHYYEEYLFQNNDDLQLGDGADEENIIKGHQLFVFDFDKEPSDPLFMVGVTVSANGTIVAAHDKNDNDILSEVKSTVYDNSYNVTQKGDIAFLKNKDLFSFSLEDAIKNIAFDKDEAKKEILSELHDPEGIFEKEGAIYYNTIHPLNVFMSINEQYSQEGDLFAKCYDMLNFNGALITKSISDFYRFENLDRKTMVEDLLKTYVLVHKLEAFEEAQNEPDEDGYFHMDEPEMQIDIGTSSHKILNDNAVKSIFNSLDDLEKTVIFKENKELILDVFNRYFEDRNFESTIEHLKNSSSNFSQNIETVLSVFSSHLINHIDNLENDSYLKNARDLLVLDHCLGNDNPKESIIQEFVNMVKEKKIHSNKIFSHLDKFSDSVKQRIAETFNENPDIINSVENKSLQPLSHDSDFLSMLNDNTCVTIKNSIKSNRINFGELNDDSVFIKQNEYTLGERMKGLKELGIIDDEIIERHYNSSHVSFGNKKGEHLFLPQKNDKPKIRPR